MPIKLTFIDRYRYEQQQRWQKYQDVQSYLWQQENITNTHSKHTNH